MNAKSSQKRLIVNADDFGFSEGITEGILRAHREGIVTSTTITANMPAAEAASARLREAPGLGVGVHLNVSQGRPLCRRGLVLADEDGVMRHTAVGIILACLRRPSLLSAVEAEYEAQIRWALDHRITPTHLDTHRHAHAFTPIFARVASLARRYHISFVRRHREKLPGRNWPPAGRAERRVSRVLNCFGAVNARIAPDMLPTCGTWGVAHTGAISVEWLIRAAEEVRPGVTEIMTHPGLSADADAATTRLLESRLSELSALCNPGVRDALKRHGIELIHYGQISE